MVMKLVTFLFLLVAASAAAKLETTNQRIPILSYTNENNPNGSYRYSYKTGNGISVEEEGSLKNGGQEGLEVQTSKGRYSYTAPEGQVITVTWQADDTGFHAEITKDDDDSGLSNKVIETESSAGPRYRGK